MSGVFGAVVATMPTYLATTCPIHRRRGIVRRRTEERPELDRLLDRDELLREPELRVAEPQEFRRP